MAYRITVAGTILEGEDIKVLLRHAVKAREGKRNSRPRASEQTNVDGRFTAREAVSAACHEAH